MNIELLISRNLKPRDRLISYLAAWRSKRMLRALGIHTSIARINQGADSDIVSEDGSLLAHRYLQKRHQQREDDTRAEVTFSENRLTVLQSNGREVRGSFGYSIRPYENAVLSVPEIRSRAGRIGMLALSKVVAYTAVHETGHLLGLVDEGQERSTQGEHCVNECIMRSTRNPQETSNLIRQMGGRLALCGECESDARQFVNNSSNPQVA